MIVPRRRYDTLYGGFRWEVPAEFWRPGLNRLTLESADPAFPVGIAIGELSFERLN